MMSKSDMIFITEDGAAPGAVRAEDVRADMEGRRFVIAVKDQNKAAEATARIRAVLPAASIYIVPAPAFCGCADLSTLLNMRGDRGIGDIVQAAVPAPASALLDISNVQVSARARGILSGLPAIDRGTGGFQSGELSVWSGRCGSGKSTLVNQGCLAAIDQGLKVAIYSGELSARRCKAWMALQAAGHGGAEKIIDQWSGKEYYTVQSSLLPMIDDWWRGKLFLYDNSVSGAGEFDNVMRAFQEAVLVHGCKVFVIDNLMSLDLNGCSDDGLYRAQSAFVGKMVEFAHTYDAHVHLVAHPRKQGENEGLNAGVISGSSDIGNKADNIFYLERLDEEKAHEKGFSSVLRCLKNREWGDTFTAGLDFDYTCRRFVPASGVPSSPGTPRDILPAAPFGWADPAEQADFDLPF